MESGVKKMMRNRIHQRTRTERFLSRAYDVTRRTFRTVAGMGMVGGLMLLASPARADKPITVAKGPAGAGLAAIVHTPSVKPKPKTLYEKMQGWDKVTSKYRVKLPPAFVAAGDVDTVRYPIPNDPQGRKFIIMATVSKNDISVSTCVSKTDVCKKGQPGGTVDMKHVAKQFQQKHGKKMGGIRIVVDPAANVPSLGKTVLAYAVGVEKPGDKAKPNGKPLPYARIGYVYSLQKVGGDPTPMMLASR